MPRWTAEEHTTLLSLLEDGILIQTLCDAIPNKTEGAIVTRARNKKLGLDFRTSRKDGKLYKGVSRRQKTKAEIGEVSSDKIRSVGKNKNATNISVPTISESLENLTTDIVSNNLEKEKYTGLNAYTDAVSILQSNNLPVDHNFVCTFSKYILSTKDSA